MTLMIYFERQDTQALGSLISSFRTYLNRNQVISEFNRLAYRNFINWSARIYRLSDWELRAQRNELAAELETVAVIVGREWLLARIRGEKV